MEKTAVMDEERLLADVAKGDELAFTALFDRYYPQVYRTAMRLTGDAMVAEEIVQDTFLKVWLKKEELPALTNFKGWLYTIARNFTYNALREEQTERARLLTFVEEVWKEEEGPAADADLQEKEFSALLEEAIHQLPEKQRETFRLIKVQQLKRNEAAALLEVSPETVKWNLEQAVKKVRAYCLVRLPDWPKIWILYLFSKYL